MEEREYLITYTPKLSFVAYLTDEEFENFDPTEYFLDGLHTWVMETHRDDVDENIKMEAME